MRRKGRGDANADGGEDVGHTRANSAFSMASSPTRRTTPRRAAGWGGDSVRRTISNERVERCGAASSEVTWSDAEWSRRDSILVSRRSFRASWWDAHDDDIHKSWD